MSRASAQILYLKPYTYTVYYILLYCTRELNLLFSSNGLLNSSKITRCFTRGTWKTKELDQKSIDILVNQFFWIKSTFARWSNFSRVSRCFDMCIEHDFWGFV
jgi:hypothetical protein